MTKQEALNKFCEAMGFNQNTGETKLQFLQKKQKEWALTIIKQYVSKQRVLEGKQLATTELIGLDI